MQSKGKLHIAIFLVYNSNVHQFSSHLATTLHTDDHPLGYQGVAFQVFVCFAVAQMLKAGWCS